MPAEDAVDFVAIQAQTGGNELVFVVRRNVLPRRPMADEQFGYCRMTQAHCMLVQAAPGKPLVPFRSRVRICAMSEAPLRQFDIVFLHGRAEVPARPRAI